MSHLKTEKKMRAYKLKKDTNVHVYEHHTFAVPHASQFVTHIDLSPAFPPPYDQGQLGSCTANAICGAYEFDQLKQKESLSVFSPSRLMLYYEERDKEGTVGDDAGAEIKDGVAIVCSTGVCSEKSWPYDPSKFTVKPPTTCYNEAKSHHGVAYKRLVPTLNNLKQCLINGFPFVFGMDVYESFESQAVASSGIVPMPKPSEQCLGGHAVCCVGFDDKGKYFKVRNSWGSDWGLGGYFQLPYAYMISIHTSDFWSISSVFDANTAKK